jgi:hypothetical protein
MRTHIYQIFATAILSFCSFNSNAQVCLLIDRIDDFAGDKSQNKNFWRDLDSGPNYFGINPNTSDSELYDFIFRPYDWSCGSKLRVYLEDEETNKIAFDSTYSREELKYLYLTKYQKYADHLIIRLNFVNHPLLIFDENRASQYFRLKIYAIDSIGRSTEIYGNKKSDKIFVFNNEPN